MSAIVPFPPAYPHGTLAELFPDVFFVTGSVRLPGPIPVFGSRNMTVVRDGRSLTVINTVRLDDAGLEALDALGKVDHVVRLAGFHGSDDAFYKDRYQATVWTVPGHVYTKGFNLNPPPEAHYFKADRVMDGTALPVSGRLYAFASCTNGEGLLILDREGGIAVAGDVLQNWAGPDPYFNWLGRMAFKTMGFFKAHNVGPGWLKQTRPHPDELRAVLDLPFEHVLPSHGAPVIGNAREHYRPALLAAAEWATKARA